MIETPIYFVHKQNLFYSLLGTLEPQLFPMYKKRTHFILGIIIALASYFSAETATAQIVDSGYVLYLKTPRLQSYPPFNTGMPLEVVIGYIYIDSLRKQWSRDVDSFFGRMTNSDTLRQALKYLYNVDDYDPIKFLNYRRTSPQPRSGPTYHTSGELIRADLLEQAGRVLPDTERTKMICYADVIARIVVTGLEPRYNNSKGASDGFPNQIIVSSEVVDTIKGRVLPSCFTGYLVKGKQPTPLTLPNCLPFCYSPQEHLSGLFGDVDYGLRHTMTDSLGNPWVKLGGEYIAFLSFDLVGGDSLSIYYSASLPKIQTTQGSLYKVIAGHVSDPNNDLGFGTNPTVSDFIAGLRAKIYSITHPQ